MSAKKGPEGDKQDENNAPKITDQLPTLNLNVTKISGSTGITFMSKRLKEMHEQMTTQLDILTVWASNPMYANYCAAIKVAINKMQAENEMVIGKMYPSMEMIESLKKLLPEAQKTIEQLAEDKEMIKNNRKQREEELWDQMVRPYQELYDKLVLYKEKTHELLKGEGRKEFNRAVQLKNMRQELELVKREQNDPLKIYYGRLMALSDACKCQQNHLKMLNAKIKKVDEKLEETALLKRKSYREATKENTTGNNLNTDVAYCPVKGAQILRKDLLMSLKYGA